MNSILNRRRFLAAGTTVAAMAAIAPDLTLAAAPGPKVKIGLLGCGGRGRWILDLFRKHGGFEVVALGDYFQDRVDEVGQAFEVPAGRRFTGLNCDRRLLEQNVDAVVIESPPYFHPRQAQLAVQAGKHVYLAKPVAVDVPGCQTIEQSGRLATERKLAFLVDFQTRAHPSYQEAVKRVHSGMIGKLISAEATYETNLMFSANGKAWEADPKNPEVRLRHWPLDRALSGDVITEQTIHALDVATWFLDSAPLKAVGTGGRIRPFGECWDHFALLFEFPNNLTVSFNSKQVGFGYDDILCRVYGTEGTADTHYFGDVKVKSRDDLYNGGRMGNLYTDGVVLNIATFHRSITEGEFSNPTVAPSVRSTLTTLLGRAAAYAHGEVTWKSMMQSRKALEFPTRGLRS